MPKRLVACMVAVVSAVILVTGPLGQVADAGPPDGAEGAGPLARDVFVVVGLSLRNPDASTSPDEPLYNLAGLGLESTPGDPVTWGEWSAATATTRVATIGGPDGRRTDARISMVGLVPGGVYSVFWLTIGPDSEQPLCPGVERLLPLDAFKPDAGSPDPNSFVAGAAGVAEFHGRVDGELLGAAQLFFTVVYHADGQTYYPFPNRGEFLTQGEACRSSFGHDAMRHLSIAQKQ
jgi:hypothetical protein